MIKRRAVFITLLMILNLGVCIWLYYLWLGAGPEIANANLPGLNVGQEKKWWVNKTALTVPLILVLVFNVFAIVRICEGKVKKGKGHL